MYKSEGRVGLGFGGSCCKGFREAAPRAVAHDVQCVNVMLVHLHKRVDIGDVS